MIKIVTNDSIAVLTVNDLIIRINNNIANKKLSILVGEHYNNNGGANQYALLLPVIYTSCIRDDTLFRLIDIRPGKFMLGDSFGENTLNHIVSTYYWQLYFTDSWAEFVAWLNKEGIDK